MKSVLRCPYKEIEFPYEGEYKELKYKALKNLGTFDIEIYYLLTSGLGTFDYKNDLKELGNDIKLYDLKLGQYLLEGNTKNDLVSIVEAIEKDGIQIEAEFEFKDKFYFVLYKPKINGEVNIEIENYKNKIDDIF